jgi:hypothetical protein
MMASIKRVTTLALHTFWVPLSEIRFLKPISEMSSFVEEALTTTTQSLRLFLCSSVLCLPRNGVNAVEIQAVWFTSERQWYRNQLSYFFEGSSKISLTPLVESQTKGKQIRLAAHTRLRFLFDDFRFGSRSATQSTPRKLAPLNIFPSQWLPYSSQLRSQQTSFTASCYSLFVTEENTNFHGNFLFSPELWNHEALRKWNPSRRFSLPDSSWLHQIEGKYFEVVLLMAKKCRAVCMKSSVYLSKKEWNQDSASEKEFSRSLGWLWKISSQWWISVGGESQ